MRSRIAGTCHGWSAGETLDSLRETMQKERIHGGGEAAGFGCASAGFTPVRPSVRPSGQIHPTRVHQKTSIYLSLVN